MRTCSVPVCEAIGRRYARGEARARTLQRKNGECAHRFEKPWEALSANLSPTNSHPADVPIQRRARHHLPAPRGLVGSVRLRDSGAAGTTCHSRYDRHSRAVISDHGSKCIWAPSRANEAQSERTEVKLGLALNGLIPGSNADNAKWPEQCWSSDWRNTCASRRSEHWAAGMPCALGLN